MIPDPSDFGPAWLVGTVMGNQNKTILVAHHLLSLSLTLFAISIRKYQCKKFTVKIHNYYYYFRIKNFEDFAAYNLETFYENSAASSIIANNKLKECFMNIQFHLFYFTL